MRLVCKRLPGNDATLRFISPFFTKDHVREYCDDRVISPYGLYRVFNELLAGTMRAYGVFELDDDGKARRFDGFCFGWLRKDGVSFEFHAFFDRWTPAFDCLELAKVTMRDDYRNDGIPVQYAVACVSEHHRAAKWMARRAGCRDCGIAADKSCVKGNHVYPCREFRIEL